MNVTLKRFGYPASTWNNFPIWTCLAGCSARRLTRRDTGYRKPQASDRPRRPIFNASVTAGRIVQLISARCFITYYLLLMK